MQTDPQIYKFLAILFILVGTIFSGLGMLGFIRFPDVYTRLHATGKVSALGASFLVFAAIAGTDLTFGKGFVLVLLLLIGSPVVSHVIASAAYKAGVPMVNSQRDDLAKVLPRNSGKDI